MRTPALRVILTVGAIVAVAAVLTRGAGTPAAATRSLRSMVRPDLAMATGRDDLVRTIATMDARLSHRPHDTDAAVQLGAALLRQSRVTGNAGLAIRAETALASVLAHDPGAYSARRMLAAVYLSEHRFREALAEADRCRAERPDDAWTYGVVGDAHLELGEYPEAFVAFDRMAALRPNAAAYARVSYARQLSGDLPGALQLMKMAADATSPQDAEGLAWHHAQLGQLHLESGRLDDAEREFTQAGDVFPDHPFVWDGLARVQAAKGDYRGALELVDRRLEIAGSPDDLAFAGDLLTKLGRLDEANRRYRLAEAAWRSDTPEPARLARFLADRGGSSVTDAVTLVEQTWSRRRDIVTADALAWAYFRAGRIDDARRASEQALRTGSRDRVIRYHAAAIARAAGQIDRARRLVADALDGHPTFDVRAAADAAVLRRSLTSPFASVKR